MIAVPFLSPAHAPTFLLPQVLPALALLPLIYWWLHRSAQQRRQRLQGMLGERLEIALHQTQQRRRLAGRVCFASALLFTVLAWAQPSWGEEQQALKTHRADVVICLDVSRSMLAADHAPNRLESARQSIQGLSELAKGDRLALVNFAGQARLAIPLTEDLLAFQQLLELSQPSSISVGGSDLGVALTQAFKALPADGKIPRCVVVLSDGEDWGAQAISSAQYAAEHNIPIHCIGYGSVLGSKIPLDGDFLQDSESQDVVSKLNASILQECAGLSGGVYLEAAVSPEPLRQIYQDQILKMPREVRDDGAGSRPQNRHQWPLALACLLWLFEWVLVRPRKR